MARLIRSAAPRAAKSQMQTIFETRTKAAFDLMPRRKAVVRTGRVVPFTLEEYRAWVLGQFGKEGWEGAVRCYYCSDFLNVQTFVVDHKTPIREAWMGSLGLENLCLCCQSCNTRKGGLSEAGFRALVRFIVEGKGLSADDLDLPMRFLDSRDQGDIFARLANGGEGAKAMWKRKSHARKAAAPGPLFR